MFEFLKKYNARRITRNELSRMSDKQLLDIGVYRRDISTIVKNI